MKETTGKNRAYHLEMMLREVVGLHLKQKAGLNGGDTRSYLSLDLPEQQILIELLEDASGMTWGGSPPRLSPRVMTPTFLDAWVVAAGRVLGIDVEKNA